MLFWIILKFSISILFSSVGGSNSDYSIQSNKDSSSSLSTIFFHCFLSWYEFYFFCIISIRQFRLQLPPTFCWTTVENSGQLSHSEYQLDSVTQSCCSSGNWSSYTPFINCFQGFRQTDMDLLKYCFTVKAELCAVFFVAPV